jgi:hypothetical protein
MFGLEIIGTLAILIPAFLAIKGMIERYRFAPIVAKSSPSESRSQITRDLIEEAHRTNHEWFRGEQHTRSGSAYQDVES